MRSWQGVFFSVAGDLNSSIDFCELSGDFLRETCDTHLSYPLHRPLASPLRHRDDDNLRAHRSTLVAAPFLLRSGETVVDADRFRRALEADIATGPTVVIGGVERPRQRWLPALKGPGGPQNCRRVASVSVGERGHNGERAPYESGPPCRTPFARALRRRSSAQQHQSRRMNRPKAKNPAKSGVMRDGARPSSGRYRT